MADPPHIVLFSGGTACRTVNIALARMGARLTRIVPAWDSGGSSRVLREAFGMLPVGDVRQALMTMAHGEGRAGDVVKICNARISEALGPAGARDEFRYYARGDHPLLRRMQPHFADPILACLRLFEAEAGAGFDYRGGSIGNFVLTGAYLAERRDIDAAIARFRELLAISGNVWPASVQDDVELAATLGDGRVLERQHLVTRMSPEDGAVGIRAVALAAGGGVRPNAETLAALGDADAIVFGPGSLYTSILPHLLVKGVASAIRARPAVPKVFVGNILECAETRGMTLEAHLRAFLAVDGSGEGRLLTHVLGNAELFPFPKTVGAFSYLRLGGVGRLCHDHGIEFRADDVEDAWVRGHHDGRAVASAIVALAARE